MGIIIWQSQFWANPSALIGSFSVGNLQYGPFPRKRSKPCIFVLEQSRQIHNLQPKQREKNCEYYHSSQGNYQKDKKIEKLKDKKLKRLIAPEVHFTIRNRVPYNKQLTNRACSGRTATTEGQYSPVRPSRSVSKRLILVRGRGNTDRPARSVQKRPRAIIPQCGPKPTLRAEPPFVFFFTEEEKSRLCPNRVNSLKPPQPELLA